MSRPTITDPVLGTLRYRRDWYEWSEWVGRAEFAPGREVEVVVMEPRFRGRGREREFEQARANFLTVREEEPELLADMICDLIGEGEWPGLNLADVEIAPLAEQFRLIRVVLHTDTSAGLYYLGPEAVFGRREIHCSSDEGCFAGVYLGDEPADEPADLVEVVRATDLFRAVAEACPGVEVWPDPEHHEDDAEYCWVMSRDEGNVTNLAYLRRQGRSLQLQIENRDGERRWLDLAGYRGKELLKHVRPRWTFS
jgi:hypothetical protein